MAMVTPTIRSRLGGWLGGSADDDVLRWIYGCLVAGAFSVAVLDYAGLEERAKSRAVGYPTEVEPTEMPLLPSTRTSGKPNSAPIKADAKLRQPMAFELQADGRLLASGTISPGSAELFAAEVAKRGSYVRTVVLSSPGGSVRDALAMGRLIRERKFNTEVEAGQHCASSCPLMFAGGVERRAARKSLIGVHQVSSLERETLSGAAGMEGAQQVSAACQKHLRELGIDLGVWIHAMETPPSALHYFSPAELIALKLATTLDAAPRPQT